MNRGVSAVFRRLRTALMVVCCPLAVGNLSRADIKPVDFHVPVLILLAIDTTPELGNFNNSSPNAQHVFNILDKALVVSSLQSLTFSRNGKLVTIVLNESDRKTLAELTRKWTGHYLRCSSSCTRDSVVFPIKAPMEDGIFEFDPAKSKPSGSIAQCLRTQFRSLTTKND